MFFCFLCLGYWFGFNSFKTSFLLSRLMIRAGSSFYYTSTLEIWFTLLIIQFLYILWFMLKSIGMAKNTNITSYHGSWNTIWYVFFISVAEKVGLWFASPWKYSSIFLLEALRRNTDFLMVFWFIDRIKWLYKSSVFTFSLLTLSLVYHHLKINFIFFDLSYLSICSFRRRIVITS